MYPRLLHIYGPLYIQSYGFFIALGILVFNWLLMRDAKRIQLIDDAKYQWLLIIGIISGVFGGRVLFFLTDAQPFHIQEFFEVWYGGFAVLGALLGVLAIVPFYLYYYSIPVLALFDRVALYTPLLQSISRIGCFLAGCCYGKPALIPWAVTYAHKASMAPQGIALHPAQLYSSLLLFIIFCILMVVQRWFKNDGQLLALYLFLIGIERFVIDFFRNDQTFCLLKTSSVSDHQLIALLILLAGMVLFFVSCLRKTVVKSI